MAKEVYKKSWKDLKNNLILFLPDITKSILSAAAAYSILLLTGLFREIVILGNVVGQQRNDYILGFFLGNLDRIIIGLAVYGLFNYFVISGLIAAKHGMMFDVNNGRTTLRKAIEYVKRYYGNVLSIRAIVFFLTALPLLLGIFMIMIGTRYVSEESFIVLPLLVIYFVYSAILGFSLFFKYPIMLNEKKKPWETIKLSYNYLIKKPKNLFKTWLAVLATVLAIIVAASLLEQIAMMAQIGLLVSLFSLVKMLSNLVASVWRSLYKMEFYCNNRLKVKG